MRRFFIPVDKISADTCEISGSDAHHLIRVLRKNVGDEIPATDGRGNRLTLKIEKIQSDVLHCNIIRKESAPERKLLIRVYQCIQNQNGFDSTLARLTEMGVSSVVPVISERVNFKLSGEKAEKKFQRWNRIALETMKKTGRSDRLKLLEIIKLKNIDSLLLPDSLKILPWEAEEEKSLKSLLLKNKNPSFIELLIGPEGGISGSEADFLKNLGFQSVTLGKRILTVETACIATVSNLYYELEAN